MADQDLGSAVLYLKADQSEYNSNLDAAKGKAQDFDATSAKTSEDVVSSWGGIAAGIAAAVVAASIVIGKLLDSYGSLEDATIKLNNAFNAQGWEASTASQDIENLASSLEGSTRFSKTATDSAAAMLEQLTGMSEAMVAKAIPAIQDMSSAMGMDLTTSAESVARAMETGALRIGRMTISFKDIQDPAQRFDAIMKTLNEKFGGMAQALGESTIGSLTKLKNAFSDLAEVGGRALSIFILPILNAITPLIKGFADWADANQKYVDSEKAVMAGTATAAQQLTFYGQQVENAKNKIKDLQAELEPTSATMLNTWGPAKAALIAEINRQIQVQTDLMNFSATTIKDINTLTDEKQAKTKAAQAASTAAAAQDKQDEKDYQQLIADNEKKQKTYYDNLAKEEKTERDDKLKFLNEESGAEAAHWTAAGREADAAAKKIDAGLNDMAARWVAMGNACITSINTQVKEVEILSTEFKKAFDAIASDVQETMSQIQNIMDLYWQGQTNALDKWYQDQLAALGDMTNATQAQLDAKAALDKEYQQKLSDIKKAQWHSDQDIALANAVVSTAEAVVRSLASLPFPWDLIPAAAVAALGAVQIGLIASEPEPAFAAGADFTVPPGYPNDSYSMRVESGEHVSVTPAGQGGDSTMSAPLVIQIDSKPIYEGMLKASRNKGFLLSKKALVD